MKFQSIRCYVTIYYTWYFSVLDVMLEIARCLAPVYYKWYYSSPPLPLSVYRRVCLILRAEKQNSVIDLCVNDWVIWKLLHQWLHYNSVCRHHHKTLPVILYCCWFQVSSSSTRFLVAHVSSCECVIIVNTMSYMLCYEVVKVQHIQHYVNERSLVKLVIIMM